VIKSLATVSATFGIKNGLHSVGQLWRCLNSGNKQNTFKTKHAQQPERIRQLDVAKSQKENQ
jgi:hypothetical protein